MAVWDDHPEVYHYTNQTGLKGILETKSLHATHYAFMNDYKEIHAFEERLFQFLLLETKELYESLAANERKKQELQAAGGIQDLSQNDASAVLRKMYQITLGLQGGINFLQPFIVSFCGHKEEYAQNNQLLSQWRYYGKDSGYAIVFDTKALNETRIQEMERYHYDISGIGEAFYDKSEDAFEKEFKGMGDAVSADLHKVLKGEDGPYEQLMKAFMESIPRYKHQAFFEEQEVRLIFSPTDDRLLEEMANKKIAFAKNEKKQFKYRDNLSPYIALFNSPDIKLPITKIIVGPHADRQIRKARLEKHLDLKGLRVQVSCSETPVAL